jgi:hypothetical protein
MTNALIGFISPAKSAGSSSNQGDLKFQPGGILLHIEELKRESNTEIGAKDIFEIGSYY